MRAIPALLAAAALAVSAPLLARTPECTQLDKAHWLPAPAMERKLAAQGYKVVDFKETAQCYRARLEEKDGRRFEGFYDPVEGHPVRRQVM